MSDTPYKKFKPSSEGLLEPLKFCFNDPSVSEVVLNRPQQIYLSSHNRWKSVNIPELNETWLYALCHILAYENQKCIDNNHPLMIGQLTDGSRIQWVLPPITPSPVFAIRRHLPIAKQITLQSFLYQESHDTPEDKNTETFLSHLYTQKQWDLWLCLAIKMRKNIIISGATGSGKTTLLNLCLQKIPLDERMIILEDVREIDLPHDNQLRLLAIPEDNGLVQVSLQDLIRCSLRLRPDRMIIGEIRGSEVVDFVNACLTGHRGSLTTVHAGNPDEAFLRMTQLYCQHAQGSVTQQQAYTLLNTVIDAIVQLNPPGCSQRLAQICHQIPTTA